MKKFLIAFLLLCCIIGCSACDFLNKEKAIKYYSNDNNYVIVTGEIIEISSNYTYIHFTSGEKFEEFNPHKRCVFYGPHHDIEVGDVITVTTAPTDKVADSYRIVSLEKDGVVYYTFEEGKANLLNFLENEL